ncbi:hypothetical protein GGR95_002951 [Sulfitobacter undariae]|uniref:Helix-turn-helix domain-containing protein n=1 Tax=Sulfitobacter undariae TaxID=1563671 RepID=A0A7W6H0U5_9RHOB|nr:hypothetical protein [Sulfitobacter undariae]MBB3995296.1 hypothetical protein [Sulfitobacter undariae]
MSTMSASALATELKLSRGRISQYVSEGKLDGCYSGEGRQRRFDLQKVAKALGKRLDPGQMMGNGAQTATVLAAQSSEGAPKKRGGGATKLPDGDDDAYHMARTQKAQEEARALRRRNAMDEGTFVLASETTLVMQQLLSKEVAQFENVMRQAARKIADELGVDFKEVRALLVATWREHRSKRAQLLTEQSEVIEMTEAEREANI